MAEGASVNRAFWGGRRVLLTGHTGFKGAWAAAMLGDLGATVTGIALAPDGDPNLWVLFDGRLAVDSIIGDLRNLSLTTDICRRARPQVAIHMAAQALVRRGYSLPVDTFSSNLIGTVNLLEALRGEESVETILVVTSDKVYHNEADHGIPFNEDSKLGGSDPYSASKAATEIIVRSYAESFFDVRGVPVATARAGNVLGGGDFASDRLLPDIFRAAQVGKSVMLRYPHARRPWQHVLDCISGYLRYIEHLHGRRRAAPPSLNFGPLHTADMTVGDLADMVGRRLGNAIPWRKASTELAPEKQALSLDCRLAKQVLGWSPRLGIEDTLEWTAEWYAAFANRSDPLSLVRSQIDRYARVAA